MTDEIETFVPGVIPPQLVRYWTKGEGAARIRWGQPHDFDRCVRELRSEGVDEKYLKGECNKLHRIALGVAPGQEHNLDDLETLVASVLATGGEMVPWYGPLAPIGKPTDDGRMFPPNTLTYQTMPAPLEWVKVRADGHKGAVTVATVDTLSERDYNGQPVIWGTGRFFPGDVVPEAPRAMRLAKEGVVYPSVDLVRYSARLVTNGEYTTQVARSGKIRAATLVSISAFPDLRLTIGQEEPEEAVRPFEVDPTDTANVADDATFAVNTAGWRNAPIAPRNAEFDADDAVSRIEQWAGIGTDAANPNKLASMFLWINSENRPLLGREGYRLPWGDIIDGKPYLIYHAIYAGAALLSGGHGGLPNIPDNDKARLRSVISDIYARLAKEFQDPSVMAPWDVAEAKAARSPTA